MNELISLLEEIRPDVDFEVEDSLVDDGILDDADISAIISELNDAYDIEIDESEVNPENFNSVDAIMELIKEMRE